MAPNSIGDDRLAASMVHVRRGSNVHSGSSGRPHRFRLRPIAADGGTRPVNLGLGSRKTMGLITSLHDDIGNVPSVYQVMQYTVIFYALRSGLGEATVAARRIGDDALHAYTGSPDTTLASVRKGRTTTVVDGFRILDERGLSIFDFLDMRRFR